MSASWSRRSFLGTAGAAVGGLGVPFTARPASAGTGLGRRGLEPVSMAMHIHASLSEGTGSMAAHLDQATRLGIDVLWWTDHDFRMSAHGHTTAVGFEGPTEGSGHTLWEWKQAPEGTPALAAAEYVSDPHSPEEPGKALRLRVRGDGPQPSGLWLDGTAWNTLYSTSFYDTTLTLDVLAEELGEDAVFVLEIISSRHPATGGRPAGQYRLRYVVGPTPGRTEMTPDPADPLLGVRVLPRDGEGPGGGWRRLVLRPVEDVADCWPDLEAGDNSLWQLRIGALSQGGHQARVVVDRLRFDRSRREGDAPLKFQAELMRRYKARYPAVRQFQSTEVSLIRHINWFGGDLELPDYGDLPPLRDTSPERARQMVERIHASGGLASLNHPLDYAPDGRRLGAHLVETGAHGCDTVEIGCMQDVDQLLDTYDITARNALFYTATGTSDAHMGIDWSGDGTPWITSVWASSEELPDILDPLRTGRTWVWHAGRWRGELDLKVAGGPPMGGVEVGRRSKVPIDITATDLPRGGALEVVQGEVDLAGPGQPVPATETTTVPASSIKHGRLGILADRRRGRYVRVTVRDAAGNVAGFSNPVWLLPEDTQVHIPPRRRG
ncbi:MAG TPA: twin-arginine translocation signal domain-containing protein [Actinomadura sp.]|nr:twin-arginine translocation signal domain-containing protein [Actinomadura sp.]